VGTEPVDEYCRQIEGYLCRKNDGHLIRVVGPSFEVVSGWASQGVPLKIAYAGIDRYFERYYRKGPRRRPVKIDFCDADVLDVFDEWRRATGVPTASASSEISHQPSAISHSRSSLPAHLERVVRLLTAARVSGGLGDTFDALIDRAAEELDAARARAGGLRGETRRALLERLTALDAELVEQARAALDESTRAALGREADAELSAFRAGMTAEAFARARSAALDRLVRERAKLPVVTFS
jgi:transposase